MANTSATLVGAVASVTGGIISVPLLEDIRTRVILVEGEFYGLGQVGAFLRIPLGYTQLYGVCTQVGAAAIPSAIVVGTQPGQRWLTISLFGESVGSHFERGVSQYPTVGDEVDLATARDLDIIYRLTASTEHITVGEIAAASGIPARLALNQFVIRHSAVVGSTGSGKSNLVAVLLHAIATQGYPNARVLVIDPHGEYASAIGDYGRVFRVRPNMDKGDVALFVPYWALRFDELQEILCGEMQIVAEAAVRDELLTLRRNAMAHLSKPPPEPSVTADSPIPFSIKQLWFNLDDFERQTFKAADLVEKCTVTIQGDPETLHSNQYPAVAAGSKAPFKNTKARGIFRQLELMKSRLLDARFRFLLEPCEEFTPTLDGKTKADLDILLASWVGHEKPVTVLDVSGLPVEVLSSIVGTLLRIVYEVLFWAGDSPIGGKQQPLLIVLEEAHIFLPEGSETSAHRTVGRIAKEGRKYGVGLMVVTQRPGEVDSTVLSQCGTMIALRLTNTPDRTRVVAAMPDDLGSLATLLPSLRTGVGLVIGEAMPIPSRIRLFQSRRKVQSHDPSVTNSWRRAQRPDSDHYSHAVENWRAQSS